MTWATFRFDPRDSVDPRHSRSEGHASRDARTGFCFPTSAMSRRIATRIVDPYPRIEQEQDQRPRTPLRPAPGFKSQQSPDVVLIEQGDLQVGRSQ
jgi:hypothetical protein